MNLTDFIKSAAVKQSLIFLDYTSTLKEIGARDALEETVGAEGFSLVIWSANNVKIFIKPITGVKEQQIAVLKDASEILHYFKNRREVNLSAALSELISTYSAADGRDASEGLEDATRALLIELRLRCEAQGIDFDALSQRPATLRM